MNSVRPTHDSVLGALPVDIPQIGADDLVRRFSLRAGRLMWLLGAGASASAGVPTAWDMTWEFKQHLAITQRRFASEALADLSSPAIRAQLQAHIDSLNSLPASGAPDEYAALFEAAYPSESDRRAYLDSKIAGAKPSYGHLALATLMHAQLTKLDATTHNGYGRGEAVFRFLPGQAGGTRVEYDADVELGGGQKLLPSLARGLVDFFMRGMAHWMQEVEAGRRLLE